VADDGGVGEAICINIADTKARNDCLDDLADAQDEASQLCKDQHDTRLAACGVLGEDRYDPNFSSSRFDNPKNPSHPNPYFPLGVGKHWEYRSATQVNTVDIVNETKLIAGVNCIVLRDLVFEGGFLLEATDDWYVPGKDGSVWYFGEETQDYETFKGDKPVRPELDNIDGSFKAGRDGDKPGIIALASPKVGDAYLEEFSLGNAEDVTEILSTTYSYGHDPVLDQGVPSVLAQRFCAETALSPKLLAAGAGAVRAKYYARGVGHSRSGKHGESSPREVQFRFRCAGLPIPRVRRQS
jgi:hypothetical protein